MRRSIFFWLEKLKITPVERKAVAVLIILLTILSILNASVSQSAPFKKEYYTELERRFTERTEELEREQAQIMARYYPPATPAIKLDTVEADSDNKKELSSEPADSLHYNRLVNINTAGLAQLQTLPGIGPAYARRILEYREQNGEFHQIDDLKSVRGIAEKRLEKLKPFIKLRDS